MNTEAEKADLIESLTYSVISLIEAPGWATVITPENQLPEIDRVDASVTPEYDLFHFGFSLCSQKVRTVLAELGVSYGSNQIVGPVRYDNYTPDYLRLRLMSDAAHTSKLVSGYTGVSAVESEGFDPGVVPTLVDHGASTVLADSKLICLYLARKYRACIDLLPADIEAEIIAQMDIVDRTPHVALLYGADPDGDTRPQVIQDRMPGIHQTKFRVLRKHLDEVANEPQLVAAYKAKIIKEEAAEKFVIDGPAMTEAVKLAESLIADLEAKLSETKGPWLFGERMTLADLMWGVSLIRLEYLGNDRFWNGKPMTKAYLERLAEHSSLVSAVSDWPGSRSRTSTS